MTPQAQRYLTLIGFFVASGYFVWLGDEARIFGVLPARPVGYLFAAIAIAGLLGLNIWVGGPLDKRKDADLADKTKGRSYRVIYHIGDTLDLRTKALQGHASLTQDELTIIGPLPVELPIRELRAAELFRLHGLGRCIRILLLACREIQQAVPVLSLTCDRCDVPHQIEAQLYRRLGIERRTPRVASAVYMALLVAWTPRGCARLVTSHTRDGYSFGWPAFLTSCKT